MIPNLGHKYDACHTSFYKQGEDELRRTNKVGSKKEVVDYAPLHRGIYYINTN